VLTLTNGVTGVRSAAGHSGELNRFRTKRTSWPLRSTRSVPARTAKPLPVYDVLLV
jgi:hypothetical protein